MVNEFVAFLTRLAFIVAALFVLAALWIAIVRVMTWRHERALRRRVVDEIISETRLRELWQSHTFLCSVCSGVHRRIEDCPAYRGAA